MGVVMLGGFGRVAQLELLRRMSPATKTFILVAEAQEGELSTSDIAALADLLASDPAERDTITQTALEKLITVRMPAGRIEDLRKAFAAGAPPAASPAPPGKEVPRAIPASPAAAEALAKSYSSQQTRPLPPAFKVPFDATTAQATPAEKSPEAATAPATPTEGSGKPAGGKKKEIMDTGQFLTEWSDLQKEIERAATPAAAPGPKAPLPIRGKAAQIMSHGTDGAPPAPAPARSNTIATGRSSAEPVMRSDTMHFGTGARGLQSQQSGEPPKPVILVADDDNRIRMVFRIKLEQKGFRVVEAEDGQEAWKRIQQGGINAIVLDMKMPGLHGLEVMQRLSDGKKDVPVVICTAYDRLDDEFVVATYPKLRYLTKPVDPDHLIETLNSLLAE